MTTCQICGREIKTRTSTRHGAALIAQHGYSQPWLKEGAGTRTASCEGSGHLPYELSRDQIVFAIDRRRTAIETADARKTELLTSPPETLESVRRGFRGTVRRELTRPDDFNARAVAAAGSHRSDSYDAEFAKRVRELAARIVGLSTDLEFLRQRREAWTLAAAA